MTIHIVAHPRLVVAYCDDDDLAVVLCPPSCTSEAILDVASIVLPQPRYYELADQLQTQSDE